MRTKLFVVESCSLAPAQQCQPAACLGGLLCRGAPKVGPGLGGAAVVVVLGTLPAAGEQTAKLCLELGRSG